MRVIASRARFRHKIRLHDEQLDCWLAHAPSGVGFHHVAASALLADGRGILIPPRQPEAIAAAIRRLLEEPARRRRIADAAHAHVQGMSWTATAERTLRCYEAAMAARR
jgi:glycosyltransferase involved in cell wall biosynthesis